MMPRQSFAFSLGAAAMKVALFLLHATLDLAADSTAAIALVIFPFLAMIVMLGGFALGMAVTWLTAHRH